MKKLRYFDLKDNDDMAFKALCDLERELNKIGINVKYVEEDDEYFKDKLFITDAIWISNGEFYGMTFECKRFMPKFISEGYLKMLLWFAKHGAYDQ